MPKFRHKRDHSHDEIASAFRSAGWKVKSLTQVDKFADMLVRSPRNRLFIIEAKSGNEKLRPHQAALQLDWGTILLHNQGEAIAFIQMEARTP